LYNKTLKKKTVIYRITATKSTIGFTSI